MASRDYSNPRHERILELGVAINNHPGMIAHNLWDNFELVFRSIYKVNRVHLRAWVKEPGQNDELSTELFQNVRPPIVRDRYLRELARLIHNYAASSATLIDHSRQLMSNYRKSDFEQAFQERKTLITQMPEHHFLKDFRNYVLHYSLPPIDYTIGLRDNDHNTFELKFNTPSLLEWENWSEKSRTFITTHENALVFLPIIEAHGAAMDELHTWMLAQFETLHRSDVQVANELIHKRNAVLAGKDENDAAPSQTM